MIDYTTLLTNELIILNKWLFVFLQNNITDYMKLFIILIIFV